MSPILVTLTSRNDSNFERSNIRLKENKRDGVDASYNCLNYCVQKNEKNSMVLGRLTDKLSELFEGFILLFGPRDEVLSMNT